MPSHQRSHFPDPGGFPLARPLLAGPAAQGWHHELPHAAAPNTSLLDRCLGLLAIVALHLAAGFALLVMVKPQILPIGSNETRIQLLPVVGEKAPVAEPDQPKPLPVAPKKIEQPRQERQTPRPQPKPLPAPVLAAPSTAPSAAETTVAPKETPPPVEAAPAPTAPAASSKAETVSAQPARFDAAYLSNPEPPYPRASRTLHEQGKVFLRVQVSADGHPLQVLIDRSSGYPRLDQSALDTVQNRWRFVPAHQGTQAVEGWVVVPISFTLNS